MPVGVPKKGLNIKFSFQPKQRQLWSYAESGKYTKLGYGGSRGGAKSKGGRDTILRFALQYPGTTQLIIRRTFPQLHANHVVPMFMEYPDLRQFYNKQEKILTIPNSSMIFFGHAEHTDDIYNYRGWEFVRILMEEATDFEEEQIVFLTTINRYVGEHKTTPLTIYTMNPGGTSHQYFKRLFIDQDYLPNEEPEKHAFIQAYAWDNVEWVRPQLMKDGYTVGDYYKVWNDEQRQAYFLKYSEYGRSLMALPEDRRKAELFGDWYVYAGQFFTEPRREYHVIPYKRPEREYTVAGAIDYGRNFALEIGYRDYLGNVVVFEELVLDHENPPKSARKVAEFLKEKDLGKFVILCDTNMASSVEYHGAEKAPIEVFREILSEELGADAPVLVVVSKKSPDKRDYRKVCNEVVKDYLHWELNPDWKEGDSIHEKFKIRPRVFFCENVKHLWADIPTLQHRKDGDGLDFDDKIGRDDTYDAFKYLLMYLRSPIHKVERYVPKTEREKVEEMFKKAQQVKKKIGYESIEFA
jgi:hypothetical protein